MAEKVHNLYRANSSSSGYGSSSGSPDLTGSKQSFPEDHVTRIYIETDYDDEVGNEVATNDDLPYIVWHANEDKYETEGNETPAIDLKLDYCKSLVKDRQTQSNINVVANPNFVQSIQVGKHCIWRKYSKAESDQMDSLLTNDLLLFTSYGEDSVNTSSDKDDVLDTSNKEMEDMDKVIEQLTSAVMQSKGIYTLTKAVAKRKENARYATGSSVAGKLRRQRYKMKEDAEDISDDESDSSLLELKVQFSQEDFTSGTFPNYYNTMLPSSIQPDPSQPLYDKTSSPGWYLARKEEKQTSFRNYQHRQQGDFISWGPRTQVFGKYPGSPGENFTLDKSRSNYLRKEEKKRSCFVLIFKSICFLLLLASFLLVIIFISVFISQGKTMFGPM